MESSPASLAELPVVVVGAGPSGLAAAAHLLENGLGPLVLEAGPQVGAAIREWGHIKLFSPWRYNIDAAAAKLLEPTGWQPPRATALPTGAELVRDYLEPLARTPELAGRIRTDHRVLAISRGTRDKTHVAARAGQPFVLQVAHSGQVLQLQARAVIDASGTWGTPNPIGSAGLPALGEDDPAVAARLLGSLPDVLGAQAARLRGRHTLVVGAGHSAINTLLNLAALRREDPATRISWAIRGASAERVYGGGDADQLPARGALGQRLRRLVDGGEITLVTEAEVQALSVRESSPRESSVRQSSGDPDDDAALPALEVTLADGRRLRADHLAAATGFRPQLQMLRELRLELDPAVESPRRLATLIDPEFHSCGTVEAHGADVLAHPEEGFFLAGMKSYGRAPTFLLATGYEQVRSIAAHLAGADAAAAARDLNLPETGVCSGVGAPDPEESPSCGVPEPSSPAQNQAQMPASSCSSPAPEPVAAGSRIGASTGVLHGRTG